jgi:HEAT repeat protein
MTPAERAELALSVLNLLDHYDPGVRGRALAVLAEVPALTEIRTRIDAARRALVSRDAYVRAQAADLLARCREPMAIHELVEHVADLSTARYELRGFTRLDGTSGTLLHEVPGRPRVAEAALFAIRSLSELIEGVPPLSITLGDRDRTEALILENAELARSYHLAHHAQIPRSLDAR